ncbi:hypothetical protein R1sor_006650 [Riccia sorocarpa]|uniref:Uncharacterized protein n=1 Tax=Riccia sorocarpa TaxID=122646 RepID=A0ABD3HRM6_9MARC
MEKRRGSTHLGNTLEASLEKSEVRNTWARLRSTVLDADVGFRIRQTLMDTIDEALSNRDELHLASPLWVHDSQPPPLSGEDTDRVEERRQSYGHFLTPDPVEQPSGPISERTPPYVADVT